MQFDINPDSLRLCTDPQYQHPKTDDIRLLMNLNDWRGSDVANIVGVDSRSVRRWTGGIMNIPYSAWRLMLINSGIVEK